MPAQDALNFDQAFVNELEAAVDLVLECIKDVGVEHKHAVHAPRMGERVQQRMIVFNAQIAAHPQDCAKGLS